MDRRAATRFAGSRGKALDHTLHPGARPGEVTESRASFCIACWTVAQNRLHHFCRDSSQVFRAPYARRC
jgi:hypothetical protein